MNNDITSQRPRFKTRTHDNGFDLSIALPGVAKDDLHVNLEKRLLTVGGERKDPEGEFEHRDHEAVQYELKVELHEDLDASKIKATFEDGVLVLRLQKRQELAPRKIDILVN